MTDLGRLRTLIVDDEPLARERLRTLLADHADIDLIGECEDGPAAVEAIERERPDLVFLDVQMPELTGFQVLERLESAPPEVIFVTAYDQYAIRAFDVHALDYLLKPFDRERFERALARARANARDTGRRAEMREQLRALLDEAADRRTDARRLVVRGRGRIRFVDLEDVDYMEAAGNYVKIHTGEETHLLRETLTRMAERLPAAEFVRVSRSAIVRIDRITQLKPRGHGRYLIGLRSGASLNSGRTYADNVERLLRE
ncbi:MAG: LytR/AlgR family response regulator transcription factor [Gemmatimonadota bacterium]